MKLYCTSVCRVCRTDPPVDGQEIKGFLDKFLELNRGSHHPKTVLIKLKCMISTGLMQRSEHHSLLTKWELKRE